MSGKLNKLLLLILWGAYSHVTGQEHSLPLQWETPAKLELYSPLKHPISDIYSTGEMYMIFSPESEIADLRKGLEQLTLPLPEILPSFPPTKKIFLCQDGKQVFALSLDHNDIGSLYQLSNDWEKIGDLGQVSDLSAIAVSTAGEQKYFYLFNRIGEKLELQIVDRENLTKQEASFEVPVKLQKYDSPLSVLVIGLDQLAVFHEKDVHIFHTITHSWRSYRLEADPDMHGSRVFPQKNGFWLCKQIGGEYWIQKAEWKPQKSFSNISLWVIILYLMVLVALGINFSRKQHSTEDFFKASGRIPWWASGLSIFGTQLSAITFMAIPAKTYATDWSLFILSMTILLAAPFVIYWFLPVYRKYKLTTAYEFLEIRFNLPTRLFGALLFIFLQFGRLGIVLLLPSLALSIVSGFSVAYCILAMGILSILYTVMGGIEAVIWTDVLQVVVLLVGAILCLLLILSGLEAKWGEQMLSLDELNKLKMFDWVFDLKKPTFWVVLVGGFSSNLIQYGTDQTVVQRYMTTSDEKEAAKGIRLGAIMALPSSLLFFSIGTALFLFFQERPSELPIPLNNGDAIFPWFIVQQLHPVWSGLLLAAVFAAAMSSLDSSMNSVATVLTHDFYRRFIPGLKEKKYLLFARLSTLFIGMIAIGIALAMSNWGISSLWDQFNMIVGLFAGGLGGIFLLAIFDRKAKAWAALLALLLSAVVQYLIKANDLVHLQLFAFTGLAFALLSGMMLSRIGSLSNNKNERL